MNIAKEKIKLWLTDPSWIKLMRKLRQEKAPKILLIGTPAHGNLGDHAIAMQEQFFFQDYFPEYKFYEILMPLHHTQKKNIAKTVKEKDLVVISGGGWMGNLWMHDEEIVRGIVQTYPDNEVIILPQTVYYTDDEEGQKTLLETKEIFENHKNLRFFLREKQSYELVQREFSFTGASLCALAPDMVLYGKDCEPALERKDARETDKKQRINLCIREDREAQLDHASALWQDLEEKYEVCKISTVLPSLIPLRKRLTALRTSWRQFADGDVTITDRLHAMLFSVLMGTPCVALNNKTGKVFGVAEWLTDTNMVYCAKTVPEALELVEQLAAKADGQKQPYERQKLMPYFAEMANKIKRNEEI